MTPGLRAPVSARPLAGRLDPARIGELLQLLDEAFGSGGAQRHRAQYPLALGPDNLSRVRVIEVDGVLASAAIALPVQARLAGGVFPLGLISNVATGEPFRGRGFGSVCMRACEQLLRDEGCLFSVLWSDKESFYRRLGYIEAGTEWDLVGADKLETRGVVTERIRDLRAMREIYRRLTARRTTGLVHDDSAREALVATPGLDFRVRAGMAEADAFVIIDKGLDLGGFIHEWGGGLEAVEDLLVAVIEERRPERVVAMLPDEAVLLRRRLERRGLHAAAGEIGFFRILDPWKLARLIEVHAAERGGLDLRVGVHPDGLVFHAADRIALVEQRELPRLIFGWRDRKERVRDLSRELACPLERILPMSFFLWGLDSC